MTQGQETKTNHLGFDLSLPENLLKVISFFTDIANEEVITEENFGEENYKTYKEHKDVFEKILSLVDRGHSLKKILEIKDGQIEQLYNCGLQLYNNGQYEKALTFFKPEQIWVDPDCGLKTRTLEETGDGLVEMVDAVKSIRKEF